MNLPCNDDLWKQVLAKLRNRMQPATFDVYFFGTEATLCSDDILTVTFANERSATWVKARLQRELQSAVTETFGRSLVIDISHKESLLIETSGDLTPLMFENRAKRF